MVTAAVIEIGTNTIKLVVGTTAPGRGEKLLCDQSVIARIGENVDSSGFISTKALEPSIEAVRDFMSVARDHNAEKIRIIATSALRDATNQADVICRLKDRFGVDLELLSEEDECRLSYMSVVLDPVLGAYEGVQATFDIGGGSTELTLGSGAKVTNCHSAKIGAVRLTERFLGEDPPTDSQMQSAARFVVDTMRDAVGGTGAGRAVGIGGSIINIARVLRGIPNERIEEVHGISMSCIHIENVRRHLASMPLTKRRDVVGLDFGRADIIVGGAIIAESVLQVLGIDKAVVSIKGLRHGLLSEMLSV